MVKYLTVNSRARSEFIDITSQVQELVRQSRVTQGLCQLFAMHTTAAVTVNEGADPNVVRDMLAFLERAVPNNPYFTHAEGNSDAHIKSSLVGAGETIPIVDGRLLLGTWQAVYFCEFDGPRQRKVAVQVIGNGD